ncbi:MAG: hypothetical protein E7295_03790 [Lachnospiraceae bacterium]|nr:hypothetical protein [Lachnospiraceae bacterium]
MAKRRMISSDVVSTDAFLGMSLRARELYVHLNLEADDDGFISSALKVTRMVGASKKHLCELVDKGYLIAFDGGLHLVTHWLLNNQIRKARYVPTIYQKEKALVTTKGKVYRLLTEEELAKKAAEEEQNGVQMDAKTDAVSEPDGVQADDALDAQISKGKDSTEKERLEQNRQDEGDNKETPPPLIIPSVKELTEYAEQIGYQDFNAEKFLAYYGSRSWKLPGGMPVTDWRLQVDSWKSREGDYKPANPSPKQPAWKPANQNDYDFEELEKKLIAN